LSLSGQPNELEVRKAAIARNLEEESEDKPARHPNLAVIGRER
jgi:hypothetical protein